MGYNWCAQRDDVRTWFVIHAALGTLAEFLYFALRGGSLGSPESVA